jgi:hypothetical protein
MKQGCFFFLNKDSIKYFFIFKYLFVCLFAVSEFQLKALHLLGRTTTAWATPQPSSSKFFLANAK